jgi:hypothetical protein
LVLSVVHKSVGHDECVVVKNLDLKIPHLRPCARDSQSGIVDASKNIVGSPRSARVVRNINGRGGCVVDCASVRKLGGVLAVLYTVLGFVSQTHDVTLHFLAAK